MANKPGRPSKGVDFTNRVGAPVCSCSEAGAVAGATTTTSLPDRRHRLANSTSTRSPPVPIFSPRRCSARMAMTRRFSSGTSTASRLESVNWLHSSSSARFSSNAPDSSHHRQALSASCVNFAVMSLRCSLRNLSDWNCRICRWRQSSLVCKQISYRMG